MFSRPMVFEGPRLDLEIHDNFGMQDLAGQILKIYVGTGNSDFAIQDSPCKQSLFLQYICFVPRNIT